jgi:RHS repeat-associated protein
MPRNRFLAAVLLFAVPVLAAADVHPNSEGGFAPEKAFQVGEIDNINMFNGNLVLTIPIGTSYPVGGGLSYGLTLVYNSTPWLFQQRTDPISNVTYNQAYPEPRSNAGLGWQISLGRLFEPGQTVNGLPVNNSNNWIYQGPDGNEHVFYNTLHEGDSAVTGVSYTRDGSYLRMKVVGSSREVEFPDGTLHQFDSTGRLAQIRNRFSGNTVSIAYTQPWTISDNHGRIQKIYFKTLPQDGGNVDVVDRIELTTTNAAVPATYTFGYTSSNSMLRPCPHNDPTLGDFVQVQLLTSVTLPDGSTYAMPSSDYVVNAPDSGPACRTSGSIRGIKLPTLGKIEWTYMEWMFPSESDERPYRQTRAGVATRKTLDSAGTTLGQWLYSTERTPSNIPGPHPVYEQMVNKVTDPLGNRREHYFSVYITGGISNFKEEDYSLPFTRYDGDGAGRFLSVRVYNASNALKRSVYVRYQRDKLSTFNFLQDRINLNRREETSRTVYWDDNNRYTEVNRSGFDGLGHYRTSQTGGNFASGDSKTTFTNYNPNAGTYELDANGNPKPGFTMLQHTSPWLLETFTEEKVTQGTSIDHSIYCFDATTGFLRRGRRLKDSPNLGVSDVLVVYTPDTAGNAASETYYGADRSPNLNQTDTCSFTPTAAQYTVNHAYQYGTLAASQYAGVSFKSVDRTIDANTGLATSSRDSANLQTDYEYDSMGRINWVKPPVGHGSWTEYVYQIATSIDPAKVIIRRRGNGSKTANSLAINQIHFDGLGRVWKELTFMPGSPSSRWSVRETNYNGVGWKSQVSESYLLNTTPTVWTKYLSYDAFGRPGTVRPPDGQAHDVTFTYSGVRAVDRTVNVGTTYNAATGNVTEAAATTTEIYDHHGRLYKVTEPSGTAGANVTTTYSYDAADRLTNVQSTAGSVTQNRWFTYDGRGFLTSEDHPEKGATGNGKVQYFTYDARGHASRVVDGPNDLTYVYDSAERLKDIKQTAGEQLPLKHFDYDTAAGWGNGKVAAATRYNYPYLGTTRHTAQITETYTYSGADGRASRRDTAMTFNGNPSEAFTQSFTWTPLGNVDTLTYPACIVGRCPETTSRTLANGYTLGYLTTVSSGGLTYATISYHLNRMVNLVARENGITDTHTVDASGMQRPGSITSTLGAATRWTTGTYSYDGAGNITKMGTSWFTYDKVSRLTTGTVFTGTIGNGTQKQQTYTFDAFGNLTAVGGSPGRNIAVNTATNRLVTSTDPATLTTYDSAGNLTAWNGAATYDYDAFNQMWRMKSGNEEWLYVYTADNERVWSFKVGANFSRWTLRDLSNKVLREYTNNGGTWSIADDYLYRGDLLLAGETPSGRRHFHLDHLGTPRLITNSTGGDVAYHVYYPFGEEATAFNLDTERMKFTGHERDLASMAGVGDDLDYMHARYCSPIIGRFLSVDPVLDSQATAKKPQKWNRYSYVLGNPLQYNDITGQEENLVGGGVVINSSSQDVYIAFDADRLGDGGANLDVVIVLHPGETSEAFTYDADAVVVAPGQSIGNATSGSYKVSAGTVEIKDQDKKLAIAGNPTYFAMKKRENSADQSGYQDANRTPQQWRISKTQADMERDKQRTAATREARESQAWQRKRNELWSKLKSVFKK